MKQMWWFAALAFLVAGPTLASAAPILSGGPNSFVTPQSVNGGFSLDPNVNVVNSTTQAHVEIQRLGGAGGLFYYSFTTASAGTITLDIDSTPTNTNFDTEAHLFSAVGAVLGTNDDNGGDIGDGPGIIGGAFNSRFTTGMLPAGNYIAAVSAFNSTPQPGGAISGAQVPSGGTFTLNISANAEVPEPATLAAFGVMAVAGFGYIRRRLKGAPVAA